MKILNKLFFLLFISVMLLNAQTIVVKGNISTSTEVVKNAVITFTDEDDTTKSYTTLTDSLGNYSIDLMTSIKEKPSLIPAKFELAQNYPNPFSSSTAIMYKLNEQSDIQVTIYDILGREIRKYNKGEQPVGIHGILWDGRNGFGEKVTTGIYFYRLKAGKESITNKMVFTRKLSTSNNVNLNSNFVSMNSLQTEEIEKSKIITGANSYICRIKNNSNTNPKILTKEIIDIKIDRDTTIDFNVVKESDAYFPLQVGNEWTFKRTFFDPWIGHDTTVIRDYKIIKTKNVNGKTYFGFNQTMPFLFVHSFTESFDSVYVRQNDNGEIMLLIDNSEYLYFSFDTSLLGHTNKLEIRNTKYYYKILSINDSIITSIGLFNKCFQILNYYPQMKDTEYYTWFAAGYGPVKFYYPELDATYELIKINIQKQ